MAFIDAERAIEWRQIQKRLEVIAAAVFTGTTPVEALEYCELPKGLGPTTLPKSGWKPFRVMQRWGAHDITTWVRMRARLPKDFKGECAVARIRIGDATYVEGEGWIEESGEALAYVNGQPRQGIDRNHEVIVLSDRAKGGETFDIALECVASTRFEASHQFSRAEVAVMRAPVWDFYWDAKAVFDVAAEWDRNSPENRRLLAVTFPAVFEVDVTNTESDAFLRSLARARKMLADGLKDFPASKADGSLTVVGHSHIDTAWLWPLRETRRKVGRTWATVLRLMERYPEFHFSASQPQLYDYCKTHHPETWKGIRQRVKEGRWELCGATWVEQDSQMPCGEALVRQFLYGNRFYEKEFGMRSRAAWLPDAFGFPWSLPQIMKKCQVDTFYTNKINWCLYSKFPYNYFMWQGPDGSRIRAVIGSTKNYNGFLNPNEVRRQWREFKQNDLCDDMVYSFGWGDGGGGPTMEAIEHGRRFKNLAGMPRCTFGRTEDTFAKMHAKTAETALPVYNGELYLELHRACQTTQARTKRNNRKGEYLLKNAEWLSSLALVHGGRYAQKPLEAAWKILLTHQFHDILPGSSIGQVYTDADVNYAEMRAMVQPVLDSAVAHLAQRADTSGKGTPVMVFNPLSWVRSDNVHVPAPVPGGKVHVLAPDGTVVPSQRAHDGGLRFEAEDVPPLGYAVYRIMSGEAPIESAPLRVSEKLIENACLRVRLDAHGRFTSVYDKVEEREVLAPGAKGNVLQFFEDRPHNHDAWDFDHNFEDKQWEAGKAVSIEVIESGPVRAVLRFTHKMGRSTLIQDISLGAQSQRVDVSMRVDWQERYVLFKVAFPVDILSPRATYEIQYAAIERPTHHNTEADRGRFEVAAHTWADLSEGQYGVSLLNDCKYGYDVKDNVLRLSLLRSPMEPDPKADEGAHEFAYALYPHAGDWREGTVQQGHEFNQPLFAVPVKAQDGPMPKAYAFASVDEEHVVLDAMKKAEDSDAIILRLYEAHGQRGPVSVYLAERPKKVTECDMMEENETPIECTNNRIQLYLTPYEIRTLKLVF